eukprot:365990-Chlamydomonas_euryale.AAC.1
MRMERLATQDSARAATDEKWASDVLNIGNGVGHGAGNGADMARMFRVPKHMIVKGAGLDTCDVTTLLGYLWQVGNGCCGMLDPHPLGQGHITPQR